MASLEAKGFDKPDETRPFAAKGKVEVVNLGDTAVMRGTFEPGWKWSDHVKPIAGTDSCQAAHAGYVIAGRMRVVTDDGKEGEVGPGRLPKWSLYGSALRQQSGFRKHLGGTS